MLPLFIVAGLQAAAAPADGVLQSTLLSAHRYERDRRNDQFAETHVDRSVIGRPFHIALPFEDGHAAGGLGAAYFTYADGTLRLAVSIRSQPLGTIGQYRDVILFGTRRASGGSYVGTNAYGARANVRVTAVQEDAIAPLQLIGLRGTSSFQVNLSLPAAQARLLALNARMIAEGTIAPLPNAELTECRAHYGEATIEFPEEISIETCWVGVNLSRLAIIDRRDGSTIREWTSRDFRASP